MYNLLRFDIICTLVLIMLHWLGILVTVYHHPTEKLHFFINIYKQNSLSIGFFLVIRQPLPYRPPIPQLLQGAVCCILLGMDRAQSEKPIGAAGIRTFVQR